MITSIVYNCNPESLAEIGQTDFVEAFENEIRVKPIYRDLSITVTFDDADSEITSISSDDPQADISHESAIREQFDRFAEKTFRYCCKQ